MSTVLQISVLQTDHGNTLVITDTTGEYAAVTNPTGYGTATSPAPVANITVDNNSIDVAYLILTHSTTGAQAIINLMDPDTWDEVSPYGDSNPFGVNTNPATLAYTLTEETLGLTLTDGVWTVSYHLGASAVTTEESFSIAVFADVECFVWNYIAAIPENYVVTNPGSLYINNGMTLWALYIAMCHSALVGNVTRFAYILDVLNHAAETLGYTNS